MTATEKFDNSEFAKKLSICNYELTLKENGTDVELERYKKDLLDAVDGVFNKCESKLTKEQKEAYKESKEDFKYISKNLDNKVENFIDENRKEEAKHRSL